MDFFGILFDMKNGKKVPYSKTYFDTLFAAKLAEMQIKTLTGTLPLTFRTSETALRSWTIYGNNYEHKYSTSGTLPLTFTSHTAGNAVDWEIRGNDEPGTENILNINDIWIVAGQTTYSVNGQTLTVTGNWYVYMIIPVERNTNYYVDFNTVSSTTFQAVSVCGVLNGVLNNSDVVVERRGVPFILTTGEREQIAVVFYSGFNTVGTSVYDNIMLVKGSTAPDHYIPYQQGVGERTVNLFDVNAEKEVAFSTTYKYTLRGMEAGQYYTCSTNFESADHSTASLYFGGSSSNANGVWASRPLTMTASSQGEIDIYVRFVSYGAGAPDIYDDIVAGNLWVMAVKGSTAPSTYVPYGYEIPISVNGTPQTFYIGDSPLTEGETVSKTSTGVDIAAIAGSNTITTELYNKPSMSIEGVDYVGVGEPVNDSWQIPLAVTCDRNLFNIYGNMGHSGGVHLIDYNVETSSVTGEMPANSFYQLGIQNAIVKGDETFVISFDKTTAGTAELRIVKGEGSAQEVIEAFDISAAKSYRVVFECEESFGNVYPRLFATEAATQTFEHIMIKKASDEGGFVPYNAKYEYNVPIDAPLTEGESITDTQTISTFTGENTLDTTMTNKPEMSITYKGG